MHNNLGLIFISESFLKNFCILNNFFRLFSMVFLLKLNDKIDEYQFSTNVYLIYSKITLCNILKIIKSAVKIFLDQIKNSCKLNNFFYIKNYSICKE